MEFLQGILDTQTPLAEIAGRLGLACLLGGVLGLDREWRHRPAGLRTHMLVSLAAACFALLTLELVAATDDMGDNVRADPIRLLEAVIAGVAFLGAGTIIRGGRKGVQGVTTGASVWMAGSLGVASGVGSYLVGLVATAFAVVVLTALRSAERQALGNKSTDRDDE